MTRDNLQKRKLNKPLNCVFCSEPETVDHLFFHCIVAVNIWKKVSSFLGFDVGTDLLSVVRFWLSNKKHCATNTICAAVLWCIWKHRNALIFDNQSWLSLKQIWWLILRTVRKWKLLFPDHLLASTDCFSQSVLCTLQELPALPWG